MTQPRSELTATVGPPDETPTAETRPPPTFDVLPLSTELRETLAEMGYVHPTPVQIAVWDPATRGQDAVVQARTGTGKTAAFGLPIVDHLVRRSAAEVQVLTLCPTRELALQVAREIERLGAKKGVRVVAVYGGAPMPRQIDAIAAGAQVVVGTPGRVLDHLRRGTLKPNAIRLLVLDESDEMLSMGFEREVTAILEQLPPGRQTLLFSATVPPDIERIARTRLRSPEFLTLSGDHIGALSIDHFVYMVAREKVRTLIRVLEVENPESAIIFCNTRDETKNVAEALVRQGFDADWLNGDLPQSDREKVMAATREGRLRFLVATDVAARGIDVSHLTHVINHDFPQDAEGYVHRTGRTGRAGRTGTAISLVTPRDIGGLYLLRLTYKIRPIEKQIPTEGELKTRTEADLVSMLAEAFAPKGTHPDDLALSRRLLSHDQYEAIVAGLLRDHLGARPTSQEEASAARRAPKPQRRDTAATPTLGAPLGDTEPRAARPEPPAEPRDRRPARLRTGTRRDEAKPEVERDFSRPQPPRVPSSPVRHADFANWQPPVEEGDDQPILGESHGRAPRQPAPAPARPEEAIAPASRQPSAARGREPAARTDATRRRPRRDEPRAIPEAVTERLPEAADEGDFVEVFVNVGRRDGARAADLAKLLVDGGIDKDDVRRIRVRERNSFVSVRRGELPRAVGALSGVTIAGKVAQAEQARDRSDARADVAGGTAGAAEADDSAEG